MRREIVHGDFDALAFLQFTQDVDEQFKVEGVGVIEVVLVLGCQLLLLFTQHLGNTEGTTASRGLNISKGISVVVSFEI